LSHLRITFYERPTIIRGDVMARGRCIDIDEEDYIFSLLDRLMGERQYVTLRSIVHYLKKNGVKRSESTIIRLCKKYAEQRDGIYYEGGLIKEGTDPKKMRFLKRNRSLAQVLPLWEELKKRTKERGEIPLDEALEIMKYELNTFKDFLTRVRKIDDEAYMFSTDKKRGVFLYKPDAPKPEKKAVEIDEKLIERLERGEVSYHAAAAALGVTPTALSMLVKRIKEGKKMKGNVLIKKLRELNSEGSVGQAPSTDSF